MTSPFHSGIAAEFTAFETVLAFFNFLLPAPKSRASYEEKLVKYDFRISSI
jgi:hypothetical protein